MKAIIFDMDGTMVDNMMVHHRAWQSMLAKLGLEMELEQVRKEIHGINEEILKRLFGDRFNDEERSQIAKEKESEYQRIFKPELELIDGLSELLVTINERNIKMAIGSAAPPENVDFVLDNLNLRHYFNPIFHSKSVQKGKPDPEIFLKITETLGVKPADCLIFEDTPAGAGAAHRAGIPMIIVTTTHSKEEFASFNGIRKFISNYNEINFEQDLS